LADLLVQYDVIAPSVRVLGPSFWASAHVGKLAGAWYTLPDPTQRGGFVQAFQSRYGFAPPAIADIAFDATLVGRALAQDNNDFSSTALTKPEGFSGVDGAMVLLPDGHVRRALAVFQIAPDGGSSVVSPAPMDLSAPGS
jgi:hypothetical protein